MREDSPLQYQVKSTTNMTQGRLPQRRRAPQLFLWDRNPKTGDGCSAWTIGNCDFTDHQGIRKPAPDHGCLYGEGVNKRIPAVVRAANRRLGQRESGAFSAYSGS